MSAPRSDWSALVLYALVVGMVAAIATHNRRELPVWAERANLGAFTPSLDFPKCWHIVNTVAADDQDRQLRRLGCQPGYTVCCSRAGCACTDVGPDDECPLVSTQRPCRAIEASFE